MPESQMAVMVLSAFIARRARTDLEGGLHSHDWHCGETVPSCQDGEGGALKPEA